MLFIHSCNKYNLQFINIPNNIQIVDGWGQISARKHGHCGAAVIGSGLSTAEGRCTQRGTYLWMELVNGMSTNATVARGDRGASSAECLGPRVKVSRLVVVRRWGERGWATVAVRWTSRRDGSIRGASPCRGTVSGSCVRYPDVLSPRLPLDYYAAVLSFMSSMNQRLRKLVGSTRRTSNNQVLPPASNLSSSTLAPPSLVAQSPPPTTNGAPPNAPSPDTARSASTADPSSPPPPSSLSTSAPQASASSTSLAMNGQQPLGRPPSYQYANQAANPGLAPQHPNPGGRPTSPMPPPPIDTRSGAHAYAPPHQQQMYAQPAPPGYNPMAQQPQGYGYGAPQAIGGASYQQRLAEVEGSQRSKAQLIGTTFSGVAFAFATNTEAKEDIIVEWPGAGTQTKQKHQQVVGWGPDIAEALAPTGYPKPGVQKVEWFKLQLMLSGNTYIDPINLPPLPPGKSEIDVAADYLFKLRQAMRNQLQKSLGEVFNREERNIRYFLTVPAIWNDAGKAATRAAAIQAGFLRDENDNRLTLITEPEAAAMFCAKTGLLNLKVHDAILIVDCGGGTVDLIAYEVEEESPFTVAECTAGSGDSCGSTALNRNFSNILRAKIRKMKLPDGSKTAGKVYAKCIMDFENRIKADFRNNGQKWAVDVGIEAEFPEAGIEEGYMTFTNEEILQCFEPVVNRILELVRNQIIAIQAQNRALQIKLHVPPQFQNKVVRPMDSVAAIVKGAVTAGITERVITSRVARRHYLMATLQPFKEGHHPEQYRVPSLDGKDRCKYTRQIFVQKGQRVKIGEPVKVSFFRQVAPGATLMYEDVLYACDEDVCPEYTKDPRIKEIVTLTSDLSRKNLEKDFERMDTPQGTFYRVYFDIYLTLDGSEFNAELVCQGEVMGRCSARFR
nr:heat shock 70 kda protein 12a [Quercus suber]